MSIFGTLEGEPLRDAYIEFASGYRTQHLRRATFEICPSCDVCASQTWCERGRSMV